MRKKLYWQMLFVLMVLFALPGRGHAFQLVSKEEALSNVFGKLELTTENKTLEGKTLEDVKAKLGGSLVHFQEGSKSEKVEENPNIELIFGLKDGKKVGVAMIDVEPGKWGPVEFMITMGLAGVIKNVQVMSYQEQRGRPIARSSFMGQYKGKSLSDPLEVGKDITGISGATISSHCATFAVKKALVIFGELFKDGNGL